MTSNGDDFLPWAWRAEHVADGAPGTGEVDPVASRGEATHQGTGAQGADADRRHPHSRGAVGNDRCGSAAARCTRHAPLARKDPKVLQAWTGPMAWPAPKSPWWVRPRGVVSKVRRSAVCVSVQPHPRASPTPATAPASPPCGTSPTVPPWHVARGPVPDAP